MIAVTENLNLTISGFCQVLKHTAPSGVIMTVPHDGIYADQFGFFQKRDKGADGKRAIHMHDIDVWPIVNSVVEHAHNRGTCIDAVRFLAPRMYVDANRPLIQNADPASQTALDDRRLIPAYENYYECIRELVTRSVDARGKDRVLFIDCHGFGKQPDIAPPEGFDLILGTDNRATIKHSQIDRDFAEAMRNFGYRVFLPEKIPSAPAKTPSAAATRQPTRQKLLASIACR